MSSKSILLIESCTFITAGQGVTSFAFDRETAASTAGPVPFCTGTRHTEPWRYFAQRSAASSSGTRTIERAQTNLRGWTQWARFCRKSRTLTGQSSRRSSTLLPFNLGDEE